MTIQTALERATVLIAEDFSQDLMLAQRAFKKAALQNRLEWVPDGAEAIAYLSGKGRYADRKMFPIPAVLLLDLRMPKVSGYEVLQWIGQQRALDGLLTAVATSMRDLPYVERAYELGAKAFLVKPIQALDLRELMERFQQVWLHDPSRIHPVGAVPVAPSLALRSS